VRVGAVQYGQRRISSFGELLERVEYFVSVVADYEGDFVLFPEFFALQLLSMEPERLDFGPSLEAMTLHTPRLREALSEMAVRYRIHIIAGSHPLRLESGEVENVAHLFMRDGTLHTQSKIHPTPNETACWGVRGGDSLNVIDTDCGPIGILVCYDSEFPELARQLTDAGAQILFVPFCTDDRRAYLRVRYCCQARAVENQLYVVMAGNTGNLPNVRNMDIQYAKSCVLTPCDFPFDRDGIAAEADPNVDTVVIADLYPDRLTAARRNGTVRNLRDRRHDLYKVQWLGRTI